MQLEFARAHHQIPPEENWGRPWAREACQNVGSPYNISATAEASLFKFGRQLRFAKDHHKIIRSGPGLGELPKIWRFPFNIYTMAKTSHFKFGTQLGFAKAHHKTYP